MAVRSIIDIEVKDGAFKRFAVTFDRFKAALGDTGKSMRALNKEIGGIPGDVKAASEFLRNMKDSSDKVAASVGRTSSYFANIASSTKVLAGNLKSATESLLRWASISTIISGLLGVGSLFGLDRLALGVGAGRREATGVGTTYGQQTAFNLSYGRFVDHSFLGRISDAASDPTKSWVLRRLGATPQTLAAGNSADIARQILPALEKFAKTTDVRQLGLLARAFHYTDVISEEELKRLRASQPGELAAQAPKYAARLEAFKRTGTTEEQYQSFAEKLEEAGETIKNTFVIGLQPVIPKLTELSGALTNILVRFLKEIKPSDIETLATKIGEFAAYLGSPEFKEKLDKFINGMEELGKSLLKWGERLGLISAPVVAPPWEKNPDSRPPWTAVAPQGRMNAFRRQLRDAPLNDDDPLAGVTWGKIKEAVRGVTTRYPEAGYAPAPNQGGITSAVAGQGVNPWNTTRGGNYVNNQSGQEMWLTIMSMPGASTPKAASMIGTQ